MASGSAVEFVPARHPEAIRTDLSQYEVITPAPARLSEGEPSDDEDAAASPATTAGEYFDLNESKSDRGTRAPQRICKAWPEGAAPLTGLENQGVTCYQNAALQSILHQPAVGAYLEQVLAGEHPHVGAKSVTHELAQLFAKMRAKKSSVFPRRMIQRLEDINPMLSEWQQEDSHEYFMSLISRLQEDSVPKGQKLRSSIIHDIFGGSVEQRVECMRCHAVSTTSQDFYDLPVCFSPRESGPYTLQQSVRDFFHPDKIDLEVGNSRHESHGYQCENCRVETSAVKYISVEEAPEYLTVHIKRFKMEGQVSKKLKDCMRYPMLLDITDYASERLAAAGERLLYKLSAVVLHEGRTVSSGHYIAYARDIDNRWLLYDDEYTHAAAESDVVNNPAAYILVYSRLTKRGDAPQKARKHDKEKSKKRKKSAHGTKKKKKEGADKKRVRAAADDIDDIFSRR